MLQWTQRLRLNHSGWRQTIKHGTWVLVASVAGSSIVASECASSATAPTELTCLPPNIKLADIVSAKLVQTDPLVIEKVTVAQKLAELKADCKNGKLVDGAGNEIYLYMLTWCWGNPPPNYQQILQQQEAELETLRKQYTVIEMTCNPSGLPIS